LIKKNENTWQVIDAWSNSTHPQLQLHFDEKTDAFFADRKEFVEQAPNISNLEEKMIELTFESKR
jgi:quinol monooxygenase YgiN